jgi:hypothetical protein
MGAVTVCAPLEPETRHRDCWYGRRTPDWNGPLTVQTIEDGRLLYCAHPMMFPIVGYAFDVRNCEGCDSFRPHPHPPARCLNRPPVSSV